MQKYLTAYLSFVVACIAVIAAFITATTYIQLAIAILLYPVLVFFAYKVFPRKQSHPASKTPIIESSIPLKQTVEEKEIQSFGISDIDKRVFLKLIGGAGVVLFLLSIFNKKAEGLFFKNIPGSVAGKVALEDISGNKIDPAQNQPTDGYNITEIDDDIISFYGYTNKDGLWFVMRIDHASGSFRYSKGNTNFPGNWNNRKNLSYDYFNNIF